MIFAENPGLLQRYRDGNPGALEQIYRAYVDQVAMVIQYGFVAGKEQTAVPGVRGAAQCDVLQEVFTRAFSESARSGYREGVPFRPYLMRIAKNLMIDRFRKERRYLPNSDKMDRGLIQLDPILQANAPLPPEQSLLEARELHLMKATSEYVKTLQDALAEYYDLRYRQGLPQVEVSRRMGVTRRRARTLESRLQKGLRAHLKTIDQAER